MSIIGIAQYALPFALVLGAMNASVARANEETWEVVPNDDAAASCCRAAWGTGQGASYRSKGSGYYPDNSSMEGGFVDRRGNPLQTLQSFLKGKHGWVSTAMDANAFAYGTRICIPELNSRYGAAIPFKVVDTGGAFSGKGTSRIDVCTSGSAASQDSAINGRLTIVVCK
jgi:3D (Asp-Asp-Asp) domain-containing protein